MATIRTKTKSTASGDRWLVQLLSMNLLMLTFFMMLNSMSTYGDQHAKDVLASVREGYDRKGSVAGGHVPVVMRPNWHRDTLGRLMGLQVSRLQVRSVPLPGSAKALEVTLPLDAVFDASGRVQDPALIHNLTAAAGSESQLTWQIEAPADKPALPMMMASLAVETGEARYAVADTPLLRLHMVPGSGTNPNVGLAVQAVGEAGGGLAHGMEDNAHGR